MRTKFFVVAMMLTCFVGGCALFVPPPYMDQKMIIKRDASGKVLVSEYERNVKGFGNQDPATVISQWAYADSLVRISSNGDYKKAVEEKGLVGVIINQNLYETYSVEIISKITKQPVSVVLMTPNSTMSSWVPTIGEYSDVWKQNGKIIARGEFTVREDKVVSYGNIKNLYWFSAYNR